MKGKLVKYKNGWMVQQEHCGIDNISFYPLHPYDTITNKIERFEGKEVDFVIEDFWEKGLEKLIRVAIIKVDMIDYSKEEDTPKKVGFLGYKYSTEYFLKKHEEYMQKLKELYPDAYSILGQVLYREKSDSIQINQQENTYSEEQVEDKFEKFLDNEIEFGLSQKEIIERIKWYYKKYVKQTKQINMRIGTSSLMDRHLVDFSNENSDRIKSASTQLPQQQTYTLEQMRMAFDYGKSLEPFDSFEEFINSLTN